MPNHTERPADAARAPVKPCADCDHREHRPGDRCQRPRCSCFVYIVPA